jgi:hypothetical protein
MTSIRNANHLAELIHGLGQNRTGGLTDQFATVITASPLTVQLDSDDAPLPDTVPALASYGPAVGDRVWLRKVNGGWLVIGDIGAGSPPVWNNLTGWAVGANIGTPAPQWTKDAATGLVRLRGQVTASTTFAASGVSILATLPAAIQFAAGALFPIATNFASANNPARLNVATGLTLYCAVSQISAIYLDVVGYYV